MKAERIYHCRRFLCTPAVPPDSSSNTNASYPIFVRCSPGGSSKLRPPQYENVLSPRSLIRQYEACIYKQRLLYAIQTISYFAVIFFSGRISNLNKTLRLNILLPATNALLRSEKTHILTVLYRVKYLYMPELKLM